MNTYVEEHISAQQDLFETEATRSLLDQLLVDSRLYTRSKDYKDLLDFVVRLRNFAPFNAMLLQVQKPGLRFAATARDWRLRFGRWPKDGTRPLLIMWPFGPVALVYDLIDTEGNNVPEHVYAFPAKGDVRAEQIASIDRALGKSGVRITFIDAGDNRAGSIARTKVGAPPKGKSEYRMYVNRNHNPNTQFATLAHELGHLCLGHLGPDKALGIPDRRGFGLDQIEIEAESVSYVVCCRNGVENRSESYLANYVKQNTTVGDVDLYQVMRAAGSVERLLGLNSHMRI